MSVNRDRALDILRGVSVVLMVGIHSLLHFRPSDGVFYSTVRALGALAAPFFLICAGMGLEYLRELWASEPGRFRQAMLRRGSFLVLFSTLLHVYRLDLATLFDWNIFSLIGVWYLLSSPLAGIPWYLAILLITSILELNCVLPAAKPWVLRGGSFPPVPFSVYFLLGILLVKVRPRLNQIGRLAHLVGGVGLVALLIALLHNVNLDAITRFDVWRVKGVVVISVIFVLLIASFWRILKVAAWPVILFWPLMQLGKLAFSLYFVQYFFLLLLPRVALGIARQDPILVFPSMVWVVLLLTFFALLCGLVTVWEKFMFKYSIEWFMNYYVSKRSQVLEKQGAPDD